MDTETDTSMEDRPAAIKEFADLLGIKDTKTPERGAENNTDEKDKNNITEKDKNKGNDAGDDDDIFPAREQKQKKTKEESINQLRKDRDKANEDLKVFRETFGEVAPTSVKPIMEFLTSNIEGPLTTEGITAFLEGIKSKDESITALQTRLEENEKKVSDIDIRYSEDYNKSFQVPYQEATDNLFAEFAMVHDKKVLGPKATQKFHDFLTSNQDLSALDVKEKMLEFAKEYKAETGEDAILPTHTSLMTSLRHFYSKREGLQNAYLNWKEVKKQKQEEALVAHENKTKEQQAASAKVRKDLATKAYNDFNLDDFPFIEPKEIQAIFKNEYQLGENLYQGKDVPPWNELLTRGVKSQLWDLYGKELVELRKLKEEVEAGERNGLEGNNTPRVKKGEETDWLTGQAKK